MLLAQCIVHPALQTSKVIVRYMPGVVFSRLKRRPETIGVTAQVSNAWTSNYPCLSILKPKETKAYDVAERIQSIQRIHQLN